MATETDVEAPIISLTEAAATSVRRLLEERNLAGHALRVFVSGGGCSGLQYGMALEGNPRPDDLRIAHGDVAVVIDPTSAPYLTGASIDYVDGLMGAGFKIDNPNATKTCSCGQSFRSNYGPGGQPGGCADQT